MYRKYSGPEGYDEASEAGLLAIINNLLSTTPKGEVELILDYYMYDGPLRQKLAMSPMDVDRPYRR